jgi:uncharacterized protein (TIGR03435 family)
MKFARTAVPLFFAAVAACAQTPPAPVEFEVASVKPSAQTADRVNVGVHVDGAQVHISDFSLQDYIRVAYRVKNYQVTGPDWLSERFNVDAKLPEGATREQVPDMLQSLLTSRFEMKMHRESKDFPVYALTVASGGMKLKEVPPDKNDDAAASGVQGAATDVSASGGRGGVSVNLGKGSSFTFANNKLEAKKLTMTTFADMLARFVDRPVVDRTDLKGSYDFTIDLTTEDYMAMLIQSAVTAGVTLPPEALRLLDGASHDSLYGALRSFGLKLEPSKAPLEVLVIDHILKTPVAN